MPEESPGRAGPGSRLSRRRLLKLGLAVPLVAAACDDQPTGGQAGQGTTRPTSPAPATGAAQTLPPTPACDDGDGPTLAQTEGPYFSSGSPERASLLEPGMAGEKLTVTGTVLTTGCRPVGRALLDFWHADDSGQYDNQGYRLRGHQFSDAQGRWRLETIVPGVYTGRTRHIHVKVQAPNRPVLTTQLYFPGEAGNEQDGIFRQELLMDVRTGGGGRQASFTFVLAV